MAYVKNKWIDHIVEKPNTYTVAENSDGTVTHTPAFGTVIQEGTPLSASNLNNMEEGIEQAHQIAEGKATVKAYTIDLPKTGWLSGVQTVEADYVVNDSILLVTPAPDSYNQYCGAGVYCSGQSDGYLTFSCATVPEADVSANILLIS